MGTIADKLTYLGQTKAEIRDAIIAKGVTIPEKTTFREYAGKIREISTDGGEENPTEWRRPDDWLRIDDRVEAGEQKFVGLHAIFEDSNFITLSATGDYTVDWGDGKIENFASGDLAYHSYSYEQFEKTEGSLGYRQTIVTVTPQKEKELTTISLREQHPHEGLNSYSTGWLDIRVSGESISEFIIGGGTVSHKYLESFSFVGDSSITDYTAFFSECTALQSVSLADSTAKGENFSLMFYGCSTLKTVPEFNTASGIDFNTMFGHCSSLETIAILNTSRGIDFSNMFLNCLSLKRIPLLNTSSGRTFFKMFISCVALKVVPPLDTRRGTDFGYMFLSCVALKDVPLLDTSSGIDFTYMFGSCYQLETIPLLDTSSGENFYAMFGSCMLLKGIPQLNTSKGNNFFSMFGGCSALKTIPLLNTSNGSNFANMFGGCQSLRNIPALDTSNGVDFNGMFYGCTALESIPVLKVPKGNGFNGMFNNCYSLSKASLAEISKPIDYSSCKLSRNALADIFKHLGTGEDHPTITISYNWGTSLLSAEDRDVARKKGWDIVG
ncbi:BspA family leucine-rich repeat surface protein [Flavobacterium sp. CAU 1735]|uniref:BspA family leucine-rich repeat surface protein n=1 Tax=Flavobacterium sp. CAU 1735 TaxID=3140361 RepID=UPI0032607DE0